MEVEPLAAGDPAQPDNRGASGPLSLWFGAEAVAGRRSCDLLSRLVVISMSRPDF